MIATFMDMQTQSSEEYTFNHYLNHRKIEIELNEMLSLEYLHLQSYTDPTSLSIYVSNVMKQAITENQYKKRKPRLRKNVCECMNQDVQRLIMQKDNCKKEKRLSPTNENNERFLEVSKELDKVKKKAKNEYYRRLFNDSRDMKTTWKNINKLLGRIEKAKQIIKELRTENGPTSNTYQIANKLNSYFSTIGIKMASQIQSAQKDNINQFDTLFYNYNNIKHEPATATFSEVMKIINGLKTGKAPGYDDLTTSFVKLHSFPLCKTIMYLFNMALEQGKFPENLKVAKIIPIHKGGKRDDPSNYRPISLLPTIGKIMEKLIYARLHKYYESQKFISKYQYGFRTKCSTTIAINYKQL